MDYTRRTVKQSRCLRLHFLNFLSQTPRVLLSVSHFICVWVYLLCSVFILRPSRVPLTSRTVLSSPLLRTHPTVVSFESHILSWSVSCSISPFPVTSGFLPCPRKNRPNDVTSCSTNHNNFIFHLSSLNPLNPDPSIHLCLLLPGQKGFFPESVRTFSVT